MSIKLSLVISWGSQIEERRRKQEKEGYCEPCASGTAVVKSSKESRFVWNSADSQKEKASCSAKWGYYATKEMKLVIRFGIRILLKEYASKQVLVSS